MTWILDIVIFAAMGVVVLSLLGGLVAMARGKSGQSNRMMRARVAAQAVALVVVALSLWLKQELGTP